MHNLFSAHLDVCKFTDRLPPKHLLKKHNNLEQARAEFEILRAMIVSDLGRALKYYEQEISEYKNDGNYLQLLTHYNLLTEDDENDEGFEDQEDEEQEDKEKYVKPLSESLESTSTITTPTPN